ncbi:Hemerythrin domain-containing protein [Mycena kentingensis (nom. inval.)]|nr:Hemerythrin domain-containing protein [Mycena kentingensis (nom. inval.)]
MPYPYKLIPRPGGDHTNAFENQAIEMSLVHNMFIRGINAIYTQAPSIKPPQVKSFMFFCTQMFQAIHHHHILEETLAFPLLEAKLGAGAMAHNVEQHHEFMGGLDALEKYLHSVQAGEAEYDGAKIRRMLDAFGDVLVQHLNEELKTLDPETLRASLTEADLKSMEQQLQKRILEQATLSTDLALALTLHDKSTAPHWPALPTPPLLLTKYLFYYVHRDAWVFAPCTIHGFLKPGLGNN